MDKEEKYKINPLIKEWFKNLNYDDVRFAEIEFLNHDDIYFVKFGGIYLCYGKPNIKIAIWIDKDSFTFAERFDINKDEYLKYGNNFDAWFYKEFGGKRICDLKNHSIFMVFPKDILELEMWKLSKEE